jgi:hypothetical protein
MQNDGKSPADGTDLEVLDIIDHQSANHTQMC